MEAAVTDYPASYFAAEGEQFARLHGLSPKECEVLLTVIKGAPKADAIGAKLGISVYTVNNHLKSIFTKARVDSKAALVAAFLRYHWEKACEPNRKPHVAKAG